MDATTDQTGPADLKRETDSPTDELDDELPEAPASVSRGDRDSTTRRLGFAAVVALLVTGTTTFLTLIGLAPIVPTNEVVISALAINSILIAALFLLIGREVWIILQARRKGRAAARLHVRIVGLFALVAAVPAILVAIVASITLDLGLDRWFEQRTRQIVGSSVNVARAYMDESRRVLTGNTVSLAFELDRARQVYTLDPNGFRSLITLQAKGRGFLRAELLRRDGTSIVRADVETDVELPDAVEDFFVAADTGDPVSIPPGQTNFIGAMFKLRDIPNAYLYTIMALRPEVIESLRLMESNTTEYQNLEDNRLSFQLAFAILYIGVAVIVLLAAVWTGMSVADRMVSPIRRLISAADEVSSGNLRVQVGTRHTEGDLKKLSDTFNTMITELRSQRDEILQAKDDIDQRARFTEAVLSGVSAAVIGVNNKGGITLANRAASPLLGVPKLAGRSLKRVSAELDGVFQRAAKSRKTEHREQITIWRQDQERTLNVQVTKEKESAGASEHSFVITIDDITDLVSAQRTTAWSDVARRIAHEIKNPLTPIQLSAERIRRRYGKYISEDRDVFDQCTDTIIRQVNDIGRMVDEFSSFARMPKPEIKKSDIKDTLSEAVFMQKVAWPEIEFLSNIGPNPMPGMFDTRLLSQAFINIIKNAAESIETKKFADGEKGCIKVNAQTDAGYYLIEFEDNGRGLPKENRHRLLEPYMTTREKGTGLGLAIVRKIMEDHGGSIELADAIGKDGELDGAIVRLRLPASTHDTADEPEQKTEELSEIPGS